MTNYSPHLPTKIIAYLFMVTIICLSVFSCSDKNDLAENIVDFNFGWKFSKKDPENAKNPEFDDSGWRDVRLPHDWSIEESFTQEEGAGATAFLPGGIGWYRKIFKIPEEDRTKITRIHFDGIYNNSEVWINGTSLGKRPYGYVAFNYDLSPYLKYGNDENVLAVRVDRSAYVDCRWYPGSGIYRNVKLRTVNKVNIPPWGTYITTPLVSAEKAEVLVKNTVENADSISRTVELRTLIFDKHDIPVVEGSKQINLKAGEKKDFEQLMRIVNPKLWDTENPNLYYAKTLVMDQGTMLDAYKTSFGIREIRYDAQKGFFLNGKKTLFKGVCLHHDGGLVGAAVPEGVWKRRLLRLKEAGCNAIRTAHNPPSEEFLDLCDSLGFLVQDEAFDEWDNPKDKRNNYNQEKEEEVTRGYTEHIKEWAEKDIKSMVLRDRNHPSVVMWSIGNEIEWTYPEYSTAVGYWAKGTNATYYLDEPPFTHKKIKERFKKADTATHKLATMANNLSRWVKEIDTTRPVTANLVIPSVSSFSGYVDALDIIGLSYRQSVYDYIHKLHPEKMILGTENWGQWHEWKPVLEKEYIQGVFLWTGVYYMGGSRNWPVKGSKSGLLDFAGFKRPSYHLFKTLWNEEPHIYMSTVRLKESPYELVGDKLLSRNRNERWIPKWGWHNYNEHWNYKDNDTIAVEVITNCKEVELFLNGNSLGKQKSADNYHDKILKWNVPFASGELIAKGTNPGNRTVSYTLQSAEAFGGIHITSDKKVLKADGYDVAHIEVGLTDKRGVPVRTSDQEVEFLIDGNVRLLGVDNGANDNIQDIKAKKIVTAHGRCLLIVQSNRSPGSVTIRAKSGEILSEEIQISIQ